jgi:hypothetical protein
MVQRSSLLLPCALPKVTMKVYSVFFTTITIGYKIFSDLESFFLAHTCNLHPLSRLKMSSQPSSSRLLDLPRELRDMIYEYALTEDQGLLLVERDDTQKSFKGCRPTDPSTESNCLKYVCRQLYYETKGLGLGLNDLTIRSELLRSLLHARPANNSAFGKSLCALAIIFSLAPKNGIRSGLLVNCCR